LPNWSRLIPEIEVPGWASGTSLMSNAVAVFLLQTKPRGRSFLPILASHGPGPVASSSCLCMFVISSQAASQCYRLKAIQLLLNISVVLDKNLAGIGKRRREKLGRRQSMSPLVEAPPGTSDPCLAPLRWNPALSWWQRSPTHPKLAGIAQLTAPLNSTCTMHCNARPAVQPQPHRTQLAVW
jgi:hypothetical protein